MAGNAFTFGVKPGGLTENTEVRILLCYLIKTVAPMAPLTRAEIEQALLGEQLVNYFELSAGLADLEENGLARFPDAPTERGVKHLNELAACLAEGYEAAVCFVLQMEGMVSFSPNDATHPAFGEALRRCAALGVEVLAVECRVTPRSLEIVRQVPVDLAPPENAK